MRAVHSPRLAGRIQNRLTEAGKLREQTKKYMEVFYYGYGRKNKYDVL